MPVRARQPSEQGQGPLPSVHTRTHGGSVTFHGKWIQAVTFSSSRAANLKRNEQRLLESSGETEALFSLAIPSSSASKSKDKAFHKRPPKTEDRAGAENSSSLVRSLSAQSIVMTSPARVIEELLPAFCQQLEPSKALRVCV